MTETAVSASRSAPRKFLITRDRDSSLLIFIVNTCVIYRETRERERESALDENVIVVNNLLRLIRRADSHTDN